MTLVKGNLHSPEMETKARTELQRLAYEKAFDAASADINAAPALAREVGGIKKSVEQLTKALERPVQLNATLKAPPQPKSGSAMPDPVLSVTAAVAAEFLRRAVGGRYEDLVDKLVGDGNFATKRAALTALKKSATDTATTTGAGWAAALVESSTVGWWWEAANSSVAAALLARGQRLEFGRDGSINLPLFEQGTVSASWVPENATIPVVAGAIDAKTINQFKLAAISTFTNELARTSVPNILRVIQRMILDSVSSAVDETLLDQGAAQAGLRPASILHGAAAQTSAGASMENIVTDLKWLSSQVVAQKMRAPTLLMHPDRVIGLKLLRDGDRWPFRYEIERGELIGMPIISSLNCTVDEVAVVDADAFAMAADAPEIDTSSAATVTLTGGDASLFQQNAQALRIVAPISWSMMRKNGAAVLTGTAW